MHGTDHLQGGAKSWNRPPSGYMHRTDHLQGGAKCIYKRVVQQVQVQVQQVEQQITGTGNLVFHNFAQMEIQPLEIINMHAFQASMSACGTLSPV